MIGVPRTSATTAGSALRSWPGVVVFGPRAIVVVQMQTFQRTALFALMLVLAEGAFGDQGGAVAFEPVVREAKEQRGRLGSILNGVVAAYERELQSASSRDSKALAAAAAARDAASRSAAGRAPMSRAHRWR